MKYTDITEAGFLERPNRFIARVEMEDGRIETVHVKNTGRCGELLLPGARVFLDRPAGVNRKTTYDLVAVYKDKMLVNMDSAAPNKAVREWLESGRGFTDTTLVRPETKFGNSRFDFYVEAGKEKIFIEVKGVTLERDGVVLFPDAPSERAVKHVQELMEARKKGFRAAVLFVIQMKGVEYFIPNADTHPAFAKALAEAKETGVELYAYDCIVTENGMELDTPVPVYLNKEEAERKRKLHSIATPLLKWYDSARRILPWREKPTPYRVWVSEIMLQQTRVEAVKPYFERFMTELPDIHSLAGAEEGRLLKLWEGLGYYNRVRNLQKAAIQIEENYGGQMPSEYEELIKLAGIGSYTAGAVSSIAFGKAVPAVDGNVLRVITRLLQDERDILDAKVKAHIEKLLLQEAMPEERPGDFNQALMELGATVCLPNGEPKCRECPWKDLCGAHAAGKETDYPKKAPKKARKIEEKTILVLLDENKAALKKRPDKGLLAGLYEFPSLEGKVSQKEVLSWLESQGLKALRVVPLPESKHIFTHKEWHMSGYLVRVDELEKMKREKALLFVSREETERDYPIPSAFAAYTEYLNIRQGSRAFEKKEKGQ